MTSNSPHQFGWPLKQDGIFQNSQPTQTRWCVFTGAPGSGKSTVLNSLKGLGFHTAQEAGRVYISKEISQGRSIKEVFANELELQRGILNIMIESESKLKPSDLTFLDRGIPDGIAFYREAGLDPTEVFRICNLHRYLKIFHFHQVPDAFQKNDLLRPFDQEKVNRLSKAIELAYRETGYKPIPIPFLPVEDRIKKILENIDGE